LSISSSSARVKEGLTHSPQEGILKARVYSKMVVDSVTESLREQMAAVLRALGHPARLRIVEFLVDGDFCSGRGCYAS